MKVYAAINAVANILSGQGLAKNQENKHQHFMFRGIDDIYNALSRPLVDAGLRVFPRVISRETAERETKGGGTAYATVLTVEYDFVAVEDGSKHTCCVVGEAADSGDKSHSKAMSMAYKYAMLQTFCIPVAGEEDADATTHEFVGKKQNSKAGAGAGQAPTDTKVSGKAPAPAAESRDRQLLNAELDKYGKNRAIVEGKIVEAMGLDKATQKAADIPEKDLPAALVKLLAFAKNLAQAQAARAASDAAGAPSSASQAAGEPPFDPTPPRDAEQKPAARGRRTSGKPAAGDSSLPV